MIQVQVKVSLEYDKLANNHIQLIQQVSTANFNLYLNR